VWNFGHFCKAALPFTAKKCTTMEVFMFIYGAPTCFVRVPHDLLVTGGCSWHTAICLVDIPSWSVYFFHKNRFYYIFPQGPLHVILVARTRFKRSRGIPLTEHFFHSIRFTNNDGEERFERRDGADGRHLPVQGLHGRGDGRGQAELGARVLQHPRRSRRWSLRRRHGRERGRRRERSGEPGICCCCCFCCEERSFPAPSWT